MSGIGESLNRGRGGGKLLVLILFKKLRGRKGVTICRLNWA